MKPTPEESLRLVLDVARDPDPQPQAVLTALEELHGLHELLTSLEPRLIATARELGVSWAELADALGVASRQAAERRYLRLRPAETGSGAETADGRVQAVRDRRAADRAVGVWARDNAALLRRLAGHVSSLDDLAAPARRSADQVQRALGDDDTATLLGPLAAVAAHLALSHPALAEQIDQVTATTERVRRQTHARRRE